MFQADPSVLIGVFALAAVYVVAAMRGEGVTVRQAIAFGAALCVMLFSLTGPLDYLEDNRSFTAHMLQHLLLAMIMPPLLLLGLPGWMLRPLLCNRAIKPVARIFTNPVMAIALFSATFSLAHVPLVFDFMCRNEGFHIATHLTFMVVGTMLWWPLLSPLPELPRISYAAQIMYLFLLMIPMTAVAAPITLAETIVYPWYSGGIHPWGLTPMADQVLGGIVMWVGQSFYIMFIFTAIFFRWSRLDDREMPPMGALPPVPALKAVPSARRLGA